MSGSGGLMQLVAYGAQDVYLTANPQVTFFKQLYRRHSNFAMESIEQTFNGVASFGKRVTCTIARNGDLISKVYLQATLPSVENLDDDFAWVGFVGQYLIKSVEIEIGGQSIDKHYGDWLHIWNELTLPVGKARDYINMVNGDGGVVFTGSDPCEPCNGEAKRVDKDTLACYNPSLASQGTDCQFGDKVASNSGNGVSLNGCLPERTLYIPLEFWFNRHYGLALPLIALQYHEVKVNLDFNELKYLVNCANPSVLSTLATKGLSSASLWVDYIYLDTEERRRFAQVAHEYLIEQLQFTGEESVTTSATRIAMSLNHPVKELIWVVQNPSYVDCRSLGNQPWRYTDARLGNPTAVAKIQLNGHDRFNEREGSYFNLVQPFQHHTNSPSTGINVYSFAIRPEDHQPSGSCNFSRIDNAILNLTLTPATFKTWQYRIDGQEPGVGSEGNDQSSANVRIYAINYNVLRIMAGMGGLAYSN
jgi:hypothetical protein